MMDWLRRMMMGRYGVDQLSWVLCGGYFLCRLLWIFTHWAWLSYLELVLMVFCLYRIFSRDIPRRQAENQAVLSLWSRVRGGAGGAASGASLRENAASFSDRMKKAATHKTFACPSCGQKLRVPRGRGKIAISCPKCGTEFIRKT